MSWVPAGPVAGAAAVSQRPCRPVLHACAHPPVASPYARVPARFTRPLAPLAARPLRAQRRVVAVCARRHGRIVVCLATRCPASSSLSCCNTLYCIAMQFQPNQTTAIQYTVLQYSLLSAHLRPPVTIHLVYCDTIPLAANQSIAIQTHFSQYNLPALIQPAIQFCIATYLLPA